MNDRELRAIVRDVIARRVASEGLTDAAPRSAARVLAPPVHHPSHSLLPVSDGAMADGPCIIEPAVPCNHCGYCKSYGH